MKARQYNSSIRDEPRDGQRKVHTKASFIGRLSRSCISSEQQQGNLRFCVLEQFYQKYSGFSKPFSAFLPKLIDPVQFHKQKVNEIAKNYTNH